MRVVTKTEAWATQVRYIQACAELLDAFPSKKINATVTDPFDLVNLHQTPRWRHQWLSRKRWRGDKMPIDEKGNEYELAPRHVWEEAIDQIRSKVKDSDLTDSDDVKNERSIILKWLLDGFKDRFGDPYPDNP